MANKTIVKAFISIGNIKKKDSKGVLHDKPTYIVMPIDNATFVGATYSKEAPVGKTVTITKGKRAGKTYTKEAVTYRSGIKYQFGYPNGTTGTGTGPNQQVKYKWISFYVPRHVNLKLFMSIIFTKITRKPVKLRMPSGVTVNLQGGR
jgi:hypothetical protein